MTGWFSSGKCWCAYSSTMGCMVETWCFTPSSKLNLLFVSPCVKLKSLTLLLVLCPKRRDSQLTGRRVDGSSSPVTRRVFFWKMLKNGWPDSIQVIECYWAFAWYHKSELLTCIYNHIYVIEFKSSDLIWYMAFVLIELIERYFSIFLGC